MASYVVPKRATEFIFSIGLVSQANTKIFQANPTIAAGDFKVSIDNAALANLNTLPTVSPASGKVVKITLSAAEMTGDNIQVVASDAAGDEWCDCEINIQTSDNLINDLALATAFTTIVPDSTAAAGSRPTVNQALLMMTRFLMEKGLVGTTMTVNKEDGSTANMTFTLDSATAPTSISRTT
jgi:hypothetical protein